ncbi:Replication-pausing checkpoint complex subunit [Komagataella phaffii CBS 7435]|uniref:Topoisomerase 1-associated factor 1 n=2 Tax=Komagataella phaffii TaxID=460519 RepID=C4R350_KOMPG|nr:Subunit of a replication-pausing checkpoint complex (Tof1p-Mrc1p-Csm3p) [Komagataella phaffii GS115]AOA63069.1 GQ67_01346T0 [Komagataella phaffii]CAH2447512.1 Replication-pausing checkpoint complex subunit [Komagataella phaffii CBS 7435]AOA67102.1 GQ68_00044T0 [Komagataella phaffii GS115]CAY69924.1 Subunit of a replication-pausing checkpoint complex (Tof1p-Mrc1p-Csm3p) [Komagataella phaffii GS115]CCA37707.1 Replication-pausing checkpoint complex subunit [Komagataella phaffii CBS 7435]
MSLYAEDPELDDFIIDNEPSGTHHIVESSSDEEERFTEKSSGPIKQARSTQPELQNHDEELRKRVIRSHIAILCSSLGGIDHSTESKLSIYKLGGEALVCLKDIKRWIRTVDHEMNNWDVASACADCNLVPNDLIHIMTQWELDNQGKKVENPKYWESIVVSSLELLVMLTNPLVLEFEKTDEKKIVLYPKLKKAHLTYKNRILNFQGGLTLKAVLRILLPLLVSNKRSTRDLKVMYLCLTFIRNVIRIEPADARINSKKTTKQLNISSNYPVGVSPDDVDVNRVMIILKKTKVLSLILTLTSNADKAYNDTMLHQLCLECLYYLLNGIKVSSFILGEPQNEHDSSMTEAGLELSDLVSKEKNIFDGIKRNHSSRHSNFGTLLSLQRGNERITISGSPKDLLATLDKTKSHSNSRTYTRIAKNESTNRDLDSQLRLHKAKRLDSEGLKILIEFLQSFMEESFDPFFSKLIHTYSSDDNIRSYLMYAYFYVLQWILEYFQGLKKKDFYNIASAFDHSNVILILRKVSEYHDLKEFNMCYVLIGCLDELLSNACFMLSTNDSQLIDRAEGLLNSIVGQEAYLELFISIVSSAHKVSTQFVDKAAQFLSTIFKSTEAMVRFYDSDQVIIQKSKSTKKRNSRIAATEEEDNEPGEVDDIQMRTLAFKKKADIKSIRTKLIRNETVYLFISIWERLDDVDAAHFKLALHFFYDVFVKYELVLHLYRLDFLKTLYWVNANHLVLPIGKSTRRDLQSFSKYFMSKLYQLMNHSKEILVEMPFCSLNPDVSIRQYFLTGEKPDVHEKTAREYKVGKLEFTEELNLEQKIGILVSLLKALNLDLVEWLKHNVETIVDSMSSWNDRDIVTGEDLTSKDEDLYILQASNKAYNSAIRRNPTFRKLLELVGYDIPTHTGMKCVLQKHIDQSSLEICLSFIKKYLEEDYVPSNHAEVEELVNLKKPAPNSRNGTDEFNGADNQHNDQEDDLFVNESDDDNQIEFEIGENGQRRIVNDNLDIIEQQLKFNERRNRGVARPPSKRAKRNRVISSEDEDISDGLSSLNKKVKRSKRKQARRIRKTIFDSNNEIGEESSGEGAKRKPSNLDLNIKSSEYIDDSDLELTDEEVFFFREDTLRSMLNESNGQLTAAQLQELSNITINHLKSRSLTGGDLENLTIKNSIAKEGTPISFAQPIDDE